MGICNWCEIFVLKEKSNTIQDINLLKLREEIITLLKNVDKLTDKKNYNLEDLNNEIVKINKNVCEIINKSENLPEIDNQEDELIKPHKIPNYAYIDDELNFDETSIDEKLEWKNINHETIKLEDNVTVNVDILQREKECYPREYDFYHKTFDIYKLLKKKTMS